MLKDFLDLGWSGEYIIKVYERSNKLPHSDSATDVVTVWCWWLVYIISSWKRCLRAWHCFIILCAMDAHPASGCSCIRHDVKNERTLQCLYCLPRNTNQRRKHPVSWKKYTNITSASISLFLLNHYKTNCLNKCNKVMLFYGIFIVCLSFPKYQQNVSIHFWDYIFCLLY